jgi:hypothetical protein
METQFTQHPDDNFRDSIVAPQSAVAWCAIFAGAVASAALSLILLLFGTGMGFTLASPWANEGISSATFGITSIVGITLISLSASALGGYIAGRLRTRWANTANDEVYFRDTAHGFLSWAVATLGTAALLTSAIGTIIGGGMKAATVAAGSVASIAAHNSDDKNSDKSMNNTMSYLLDSLLRKDLQPNANNPQVPTPENSPAEDSPDATESSAVPSNGERNITRHGNIPKGEVAHIFMNAITVGSLSERDLKYTAQLVAQSADIDQRTAESRVSDAFETLQIKLQEIETRAREVADNAREVSAKTSLWLFISLLIGAFVASLMAVYGGRQRDFN